MQALSISASGMLAAASRLNASAQRIAAPDTRRQDVDYVRERTQQIEASTDFTANAAAVRAADQTSRRLLDIKV